MSIDTFRSLLRTARSSVAPSLAGFAAGLYVATRSSGSYGAPTAPPTAPQEAPADDRASEATTPTTQGGGMMSGTAGAPGDTVHWYSPTDTRMALPESDSYGKITYPDGSTGTLLHIIDETGKHTWSVEDDEQVFDYPGSDDYSLRIGIGLSCRPEEEDELYVWNRSVSIEVLPRHQEEEQEAEGIVTEDTLELEKVLSERIEREVTCAEMWGSLHLGNVHEAVGHWVETLESAKGVIREHLMSIRENRSRQTD